MDEGTDAHANQHIGSYFFGCGYYLLPGVLHPVLEMQFLLGHIHGVAVSDKFLHLFL